MACGMVRSAIQPSFGGVSVHHHVELTGENEHTDAGEHALDDRGRNRPEPAAEAGDARGELNRAGGEDHDPEHLEAEARVLHELIDDDQQARGRAAHLERRPREGADEDAADDARDEAEGRRDAAGQRDADAER